jgi:hypothetical protein
MKGRHSEIGTDEDIPTIDTTKAHPHVHGPLTRARARQLNYQVLLFLGTVPNIHENMMLPKSDILVLLRNDGLSMDERDKHWSMVIHREDNKHMIQEEDAASGEFRTLKQPRERMNAWTKYSRLQLVIFIHSLLRVLRHLILWARPMYFQSGPLRVFYESVCEEESPIRACFGHPY